MVTTSPAAVRRWGSPRRRTAARRLVGVVEVAGHLVLVAGVLGFAALAVGPRTGEYRTVTMLTGSMRPHYPVGAVLVVRRQPTSSLRVGQVLTYAIPVEDHRVVSHRVVGIERDASGAYLVRTRGDANNGADPWTARVTDSSVWTVRGAVPHVGSVLLALRDPRLRTSVLYVVPALCVIWTLLGVWRRP